MSLVPEFELGLWNAWILVLSFLMLFIVGGILDRLKGQKSSSRPDKPPFNEKEEKIFGISQLAIWASNIYSVFLPLKLGTAWFYAGLFIYLFGMIFTIIAGIRLDTTPIDRPATEGLYRISRNPLYLGSFLIYIGISIACASWLFLLLTMIWIILYDILIAPEERWCLQKYGDAYREYMDRTPKWIGIPKRHAKAKATMGYFRNGIPYIRFGSGPRNLVIFSGGPGNELPSGLMLRMLTWSFKRLAEHFTVYLVTRKSGLPIGYSTRDMSEDYAIMIRDELGGPVDIMGMSYGGLIAQHFAADHPELVLRLVIAMAAYRVGDMGKELDRRAAELEAQGKRAEAYATAMSSEYRGVKKHFFKSIVFLVFSLFGPLVTGVPSNPSDLLVEAEAEGKHDSKDRLAEIKVPTLVIGGDKDFFFPVNLYRETAEGIPNAKLILYEGVGHAAMLDKRFSEDVLAFLKGASEDS